VSQHSKSNHNIVAGLRELALSTMLPEQNRSKAKHLATRLEAPVSIMIAGPKGVGKRSFRNALFGSEGAQLDDPDSSTVVVLDTTYQADLRICDVDKKYDEKFAKFGPKAEVILWCTHSFEQTEADLWHSVTEHQKDQSFLVLIDMALRAKQPSFKKEINRIHSVVINEFHSLYPVELSGMDQSEFDLKANGIIPLQAALSSLIANGRRADEDLAALFLYRFAVNEREQLNTAPDPEDKGKTPSRLQHAVDVVTEAGHKMSVPTDPEEFKSFDAQQILKHCLEASEELYNVFHAFDDISNNQTLLKNDVLCAIDHITLMECEGDQAAAVDAVAVLAQLKHAFVAGQHP
jgi:hypothetical protein